MSLYDGVGIGDKDVGSKDGKSDLSGWTKNSSMHLLQKQIQTKKTLLQPKRPKPSNILAPVVDLKRAGGAAAEVHFNMATGRAERVVVTPALPPAAPFVGMEEEESFLGVVDEYNPLKPNEYEECAKRKRDLRAKEREEEERNRRVQGLMELSPKPSGSLRRRRRKSAGSSGGSGSDSEEEEKEKRKRMSQMNRAAIAPPQALIEQDKVNEQPKEEFPLSKPKFGNVSSVAAKLMAKMGYKEGSGLGAKEQGMSRALEVEKTSRRGGRILHEKDIAKAQAAAVAAAEMMAQDDSPTISNAELLKNPTKVAVLRNMVGPGEVDEDLEPETAEESSKYGKVTKCVIFEMPGAPPDEAVRIFVEFEKIDSAIKAAIDMNGRFFGGRKVRAGFYNLDRFRRLNLAEDIQ